MSEVRILESEFDIRVIELSGAITETFDVQAVLSAIGDEQCAIDLGGITRINSTGVREWLHFIRQVDVNNVQFRNVSPSMVQQMSMVANILPIDQIASVALPLLCEHCDADFIKFVSLDDAIAEARTEHDCSNCGQKETVVLDDLEEVYLGWMKGRVVK